MFQLNFKRNLVGNPFTSKKGWGGGFWLRRNGWTNRNLFLKFTIVKVAGLSPNVRKESRHRSHRMDLNRVWRQPCESIWLRMGLSYTVYYTAGCWPQRGPLSQIQRRVPWYALIQFVLERFVFPEKNITCRVVVFSVQKSMCTPDLLGEMIQFWRAYQRIFEIWVEPRSKTYENQTLKLNFVGPQLLPSDC